MSPPQGKKRPERSRCCPHCQRKWNSDKNGAFKAIPDLDKLFLHFIHMQQVCTRALSFARDPSRTEYKYLHDDAVEVAEKKSPRRKPRKDASSTIVTKTEIQTINVGNKTYRIVRDVKVDLSSTPGVAESSKRKADVNEGQSSKKSKLDDDNEAVDLNDAAADLSKSKPDVEIVDLEKSNGGVFITLDDDATEETDKLTPEEDESEQTPSIKKSLAKIVKEQTDELEPKSNFDKTKSGQNTSVENENASEEVVTSNVDEEE